MVSQLEKVDTQRIIRPLTIYGSTIEMKIQGDRANS